MIHKNKIKIINNIKKNHELNLFTSYLKRNYKLFEKSIFSGENYTHIIKWNDSFENSSTRKREGNKTEFNTDKKKLQIMLSKFN